MSIEHAATFLHCPCLCLLLRFRLRFKLRFKLSVQALLGCAQRVFSAKLPVLIEKIIPLHRSKLALLVALKAA